MSALPAPKRKGLMEWSKNWGDCIDLSLAAHTARNYRKYVEKLLWSCHIEQAGQITPALLQGQIQAWHGQGLAASTIDGRIRAISHFCNHLIANGVLAVNPALGLHLPPKKNAGEIIYLEEPERCRALDLAAYHGLYYPVAIALQTGLRRAELCHLTWGDLNFNVGRIILTGKGRKRRAVPIPKSLLQKLQTISDLIRPGPCDPVFAGPNGFYSTSHFSLLLRPLQKALPKISGWHVFRHTFGSLLAQKGVNMAKISEWMGHSDINITIRFYANLAPDKYDEDINVLEF